MERRAQLREVRPLRQRFEVVDRFPGLHLDDGLQLTSALLRLKDEVGIHGGRAGADGHVALVAGIHPRLETAAALGVQQPNDAIVLELFADWPDQDGAHPIASPAPGRRPLKGKPEPALPGRYGCQTDSEKNVEV